MTGPFIQRPSSLDVTLSNSKGKVFLSNDVCLVPEGEFTETEFLVSLSTGSDLFLTDEDYSPVVDEDGNFMFLEPVNGVTLVPV